MFHELVVGRATRLLDGVRARFPEIDLFDA